MKAFLRCSCYHTRRSSQSRGVAMTKKSILMWFVCCPTFFVALIAILMHLQQTKSQPRLIQVCHVNDVMTRCPEISDWIKTRNTWELVPDIFLPRIISYPVQGEEILFATYEMEIVAFKPYSFHSTKGEFEISKGADGCIYIYSWNKRYNAIIIAP